MVGNISEEETTGYGDSGHAGDRGKHQRPVVMAQPTEMEEEERAEVRGVKVQFARTSPEICFAHLMDVVGFCLSVCVCVCVCVCVLAGGGGWSTDYAPQAKSGLIPFFSLITF